MNVIIPTFKNVVVIPMKDQKTKETEAAGIIIPAEAEGTSQKGTILAVGPEVTALEHGDIVVHKGYGHTTLKIGSETYLVMADEQIVAKLEETEEAA